MYRIEFSSNARRQFLKLEKEVQKQISNALNRLIYRPEQFVKKLVGYEAYRLRVGKYKVILDIKKDGLVIWVIEIGHRKNVYRGLR